MKHNKIYLLIGTLLLVSFLATSCRKPVKPVEPIEPPPAQPTP
jgi:hypothetical protein